MKVRKIFQKPIMFLMSLAVLVTGAAFGKMALNQSKAYAAPTGEMPTKPDTVSSTNVRISATMLDGSFRDWPGGGFSNEFTTDADVMYMQYTVLLAGSATQLGVGAAEKNNLYFHTDNVGEMAFCSNGDNSVLKDGKTFLFAFDMKDTTFNTSFASYVLENGAWKAQTNAYTAKAGSDYDPTTCKYRGTHFDGWGSAAEDIKPYAFSVSFWDSDGKDLGVKVRRAAGSANTVGLESPTCDIRNYNVSFDDAGGFSNKETTTADKMYIKYRIEKYGQVYQAGVGASVNNTDPYIFTNGLMQYVGTGAEDGGNSGYYNEGQYIIEFDMKSPTFSQRVYKLIDGYYWLEGSIDDFSNIYSNLAQQGADFDPETYKYRGTHFDGLGKKETYFVDVCCFDSDGKDLGIVVRGVDGSNNEIVNYPAFTVTFKLDGFEDNVIMYTDKTIDQFEEPTIPVKQFYVGAWEEYTLVRDDIIVNGSYTAADFNLIFKDGNDNEVKTITYNKDNYESIEVPEVPSKDHYEGAWESYELGYDLDLVVKPVYTPIDYTITFKKGDDVIEIKTYNEDNAEDFTLPEIPSSYMKGHYDYSWEEFTFDYDNDQVVQLLETPTVYSITFKAGDEIVGVREYTILTEDEIYKPAVPKKEHYRGVWNNSGLMYTKDQVMEAKYTPIDYTITFKDGETVIDTKTYNVEDKDMFYAPKVPTKDGYEGKWEEFELNYDNNQVVNVVYTKVKSGCGSNIYAIDKVLGSTLILSFVAFIISKKRKQNND